MIEGFTHSFHPLPIQDATQAQDPVLLKRLDILFGHDSAHVHLACRSDFTGLI